MQNVVDLVSNPYTQVLRILINGEPISQYSPIQQYQDEPVWIWCDKILKDIFEECGGSAYTLRFKGRQEEHMILSKMAEELSYCTYQYQQYENPKPFQTRMKELSVFLRSAPQIHYKQQNITVLFQLSKKYAALAESLSALAIENVFCKVQLAVGEMALDKAGNAENLIVIADEMDAEKMNRLCNNRFVFALRVGTSTCFEKKAGKVYVFQTRPEDITATVFNCLKYGSLLLAFTKCLDEVRSYTATNTALAEVINKVTSIEDEIQVKVESSEIECGQSVAISIKTIKGIDVSRKIRVEYTKNGIVQCSGIQVAGLKEGSTKMMLFREGEVYPFYTVQFAVVQRNRIQEIKLEDSSVTLGVGDSYKMSCSYLPLNADNKDKIKWVCNRPDVATVNGNGLVKALVPGDCTIYCTAEKVSAQCAVRIKPYMKEILVEQEEVTLKVGENCQLQVSYKPENCVDSTIMLESSNMQIVNVLGKKLTAVGEGTAEIKIFNESKRISRVVKVTCLPVEKRKPVQKKKGFWARLFG